MTTYCITDHVYLWYHCIISTIENGLIFKTQVAISGNCIQIIAATAIILQEWTAIYFDLFWSVDVEE